jgi:hypothetical protein
MPAEPYQPASDKAIDQLAKQLRRVLDGAEGIGLYEVLDLAEAKQAIAAWGVQHDVAALGRGGKVASWLVGALRRRGLGDET